MTRCSQDDRNALAAYLDAELAADQERSLQEHLRSCPDCAAEVAAMVSLRRAMKPAASRFTPTAEFRRRVQSQISVKRSFGSRWIWPAAAVALAAMVLIAVWSGQSAVRSQTFREVADLHVSDLASANPYDVVSSDRHTVKPWFQGRIPFAFNLPEFAGSEYTLLGGRLVYLHQQPAAQVVVGAGRHKISVLIAQENSSLGMGSPFSGGVAVRDSFNVETWQKNGLRFYVIGDAEKAVIHRLAQALQSVNG
jgi:anti-sigma factor RsiW